MRSQNGQTEVWAWIQMFNSSFIHSAIYCSGRLPFSITPVKAPLQMRTYTTYGQSSHSFNNEMEIFDGDPRAYFWNGWNAVKFRMFNVECELFSFQNSLKFNVQNKVAD